MRICVYLCVLKTMLMMARGCGSLWGHSYPSSELDLGSFVTAERAQLFFFSPIVNSSEWEDGRMVGGSEMSELGRGIRVPDPAFWVVVSAVRVHGRA